MHVDVSVRAKLCALAATDAPILDDDFKIFLAPDRTNRALRHAERVAARSTGRSDEKMLITQTVAQQARNALVGRGTSAHASVAACTIVEIDEEKILRFEQPLIEKVVEM